MSTAVDFYTLRAQFFPALLAALPVVALAALAVSWNSLSLSTTLSTIAIGLVLFVSADIVRRRGKELEKKLIKEQGGKPSVMMLRHRDGTFEAKTKARYVTWLAQQLGEKAPTPAAEAQDTAAADAFYERCGNWLREHTRDKKRFSILLEENITYGFRRNLLGLKVPALILNAVVAITSVAVMAGLGFEWGNDYVRRLTAVLAVAALHAVVMLLLATKESVTTAGWQYARQLILSCEALMQSGSQKPTQAAQVKEAPQT